jgi:hypothetical protein
MTGGIAAALEARTGNMEEIAALLPLETQRTDMRYQWLSRLVANPLIKVEEVMEPFARRALEEACAQGQTVDIIGFNQSQRGSAD